VQAEVGANLCIFMALWTILSKFDVAILVVYPFLRFYEQKFKFLSLNNEVGAYI
jgi:hypothetical protein